MVVQQREDGFINATQLCKADGKQFKHWYSLKQTKKLIKELKNQLGLTDNQGEKSNTGITACKVIEANRGRYNYGSWIHPKISYSVSSMAIS